MLHVFFTSALYDGEISVSCPGSFVPAKRGTVPFDSRLVRPQCQSGRCGGGKISGFCRENQSRSFWPLNP
jgi:hypothetical protein